ncbi:MAG: 16S rRNA (uracil(1498)-N(3))-methyltransferase [Sphingobacteriia bacterium]|jgi:16S rRNA (uracil1498-N3)-methyltransferase|nr:MAG: 16S rRNA (uracil(1498)-N(3))-methyltransferase [Sphingobacteriia bacterium]TAG30222.1 MAG: 16S rRNA (uracil(1498)-N(3))-methyltransferase [Sphingobacteriia bacterium]
MTAPFFYEKILPDTPAHFTLSEETSKHCVQVLRMKIGEIISLTNGCGLRYSAAIRSPDKRKTVVQLMNREWHEQPTPKNSIAISFIKNASRMEWFLEKATEIGIAAIYPLVTTRTERTIFKVDRWESILIAAMLQSQQVWKPILYSPINFSDLFKLPFSGTALIAHCEIGEKMALQNIKSSAETLILIGPEGDFTKEEIALALQHKCLPISLGNTRLRTETAGLVAVTLMQHK